MSRILLTATVLLAAVTAAACSGHMMDVSSGSQLASVIPAGGAVDVSVNSNVTFTFTHAMMSGMEAYAALHQGTVAGPVVGGTWSWSADRKTLIFTPAAPLASATQYTIHVGGGMRDAQGYRVGLHLHGTHMGGQWAIGSMMGGIGSGMMGHGWSHGSGTYGMVFSFTTS